MKVCIATSKKPLDFVKFIECVKASAAEGNNVIKGYVVVPGNGCWNHGIIIEGDDEEGFINQLTMVMMPARWGKVDDSDPAVVEGQFEFTPEE